MSVVSVARQRGETSFAVIFGEILPAALAAFLIATVGVMHVTSRVMVVSIGYELSRLDAEQTELRRENDALQVELATLKAPARIEGLAKSRLNLVAPTSSDIVTIKKGSQ
jgi:cell division protein FtsL